MHLARIFVRNVQLTVRKTCIVNSASVRKLNDISFEEVNDISPAHIKRMLSLNNIKFEEGFTSFIISCPACQKNAKPATSKLYINKITGSYLCSSCMALGQWSKLETYLSSKKDKKLVNLNTDLEKIKKYVKEIEKNTILLKTLSESSLSQVWENFSLPVVSLAAISQVPIRIDSAENNLFFPLDNAESKIVGYKVLRKTGNGMIESRTEPIVNSIGILSGKSTKCKDTAILVPNISDFLVLLNSKISSSIVCLPNGVLSLPQYILPSLERFNKLILWFGDDLNSWDSARNFAKKLGEKRCLFVRPTDKQPLPHLAVGQDLKAIANAAQTVWHKSITTFSSLREDVFSELQNIDKVHGIKWKRYPTLNRILKGHRRGELTVVTGPTGCGKTTFISDYSLDLAMQGVTTLWGSFEIRNVRLAKTMLQQFAGLPLDHHLNEFNKIADDFEKLPMYFMTFHGQQSVKVVMEAVEHAQYVHDISHLVIDNVQFMLGVSEDQRHVDRFWKQDIVIAAFRTFATRKNCHVTLVIHPRKERDDEELTSSSIFGGAKASQEADNIFIIQDKRLTSLKGKKYLQVVKNRYSGDLGILPLEFDKNTLSFVPKKKQKPEEKLEKEEPIRSNESVTVEF